MCLTHNKLYVGLGVLDCFSQCYKKLQYKFVLGLQHLF